MRKFQESLQILCNYDWVQIPLAYPQVIHIKCQYKITIHIFPVLSKVLDESKINLQNSLNQN